MNEENVVVVAKEPYSAWKTFQKAGLDFLQNIGVVAGAAVVTYLLTPGVLESTTAAVPPQYAVLILVAKSLLVAAQNYFKNRSN